MRLSYEIAPKIGGLAVAPDVRRRRAQVLPPRRHRPAGAARPRLQEQGRQPRLHLLRRQQRAARLRLPVVRRPERVLRERRAALPADRGDGDADRHPRRHSRDAVRRHRRRVLRGHAVQVLDATTPRSSAPIVGYDNLDAGSRSTVRRSRRSTASASSTAAAPTASASRPSRSASRCTSTGRGARCSTRNGKTSCSPARAAARSSARPKFTMWIGYDW